MAAFRFGRVLDIDALDRATGLSQEGATRAMAEVAAVEASQAMEAEAARAALAAEQVQSTVHLIHPQYLCPAGKLTCTDAAAHSNAGSCKLIWALAL